MSWRWNRKRFIANMALSDKSSGSFTTNTTCNSPSTSSSYYSPSVVEDSPLDQRTLRAPNKELPMVPLPEIPAFQADRARTDNACQTQLPACPSSSPLVSSVRFTHVEIRSYKTMLGDNAFTDLPLGLDWDYAEGQRWSVEEFEQAVHFKEGTYKSANHYEPLTARERFWRLRLMGHSPSSIRTAERRRKIELVLEWAYRQNRDELTPSPCYNGYIFYKRYVI
jgi:hypothetical protein